MVVFLTMDISISSFGDNTMKELETRLTQKGQVTIPAEIRARLGLKPKDLVRFEVEGDVVRLKPASSRLLDGYGAVTPRKRPEDWHKVRSEMEQALAEEVEAEDH
jgi:AbrB family looped-hinge helix DNA binding protein